MRIYIHPTLYVYLISMIILCSWEVCIGAAIALLVHELGHYIVCCMVHERIEKLELMPFGGVMVYQQGKSPRKGLSGFCVAIAGPAANYLLLMCINSYASLFEPALIHSILLSSIAMIAINMLPALPLDGGRMILSLGYYIFPLTSLISFLTFMGICVGICILVFAVYGAISQGILNCSLLITGTYLIYSAWQNRRQVLIENLYAVIQETGENKPLVQKIKMYQVPSDTLLIQLLPYLDRRSMCEFIYETEEREYRLTERQFSQFLLKYPLMKIQDAIFKNTSERGIYTFFP